MIKSAYRELPGGPAVKIPPLQGAQVWSLVGELRFYMQQDN